ncbi:MAG TPA: hypothetical protein VMJ74_15545 [Pseudomonadales bacterium]|nr:hypothetical protein [Pseudomonadales bacterium]
MAHAFRRYRDGGPLGDDSLNPEIATRRVDRSFELTATIRLDGLVADYTRQTLHVGLSAVVEDARGGLSYWALHHPSARPDFHDRDSFVLSVDADDNPR